MKKKSGWIVLAVVLVVLLGGASVLYSKYSEEVETERLMTEDSAQAVIEENETVENDVENAESETKTAEEAGGEEERTMAPDFTVYDLEGNAVKLSDFIGRLSCKLGNYPCFYPLVEILVRLNICVFKKLCQLTYIKIRNNQIKFNHKKHLPTSL